MPSIVAQLTPALHAAFCRFAANFGERRTAGGVGSGSGELSQIVAALSGPSISGFGAGLVFGSSTARKCFVRARARLAAVCFGVAVWAADAPGAAASLCEPTESLTGAKP